MVKLTCPRSILRGIWHSLGIEPPSPLLRNSHPASSTTIPQTHTYTLKSDLEITFHGLSFFFFVNHKEFCSLRRNGNYPNPTGCKHYYYCYEKNTFPKKCGGNTVFDSVASRCQAQEKVDCGKLFFIPLNK